MLLADRDLQTEFRKVEAAQQRYQLPLGIRQLHGRPSVG
jgi:hypothetical protein